MLSIIIPTLNEKKYLPFLLESLKNQEFKDCEIIVADNNSEDGTVEIAKSCGCKVVKGGLPAEGRNSGAKSAKGEIFFFLDADVALSENSLDSILAEFERRKLGSASFWLVPKTKNLLMKYGFYIFYNWPITVFQKILAHGAMGILVRREIFFKVGGIDEDIKIAEDMAFLRQTSKIDKFGILLSGRIFITLRRFEKDGYIITLLKYLACGLHMLFFGPVKQDIFKYRFGYSQKDKKGVY